MKNRLINCANRLAGHYFSLKHEVLVFTKERSLKLKTRLSQQDGFGMNEILGIAATLIIAAFIIIPQLSDFSKSIMEGLSDWWDGTIKSKLFLPKLS